MEEDEDFENMFRSKASRRRQQQEDTRGLVEGFIDAMTQAAKDDLDAKVAGKPAIQKLKMLPEVERMLGRHNLHTDFLDSGILKAFKVWNYTCSIPIWSKF